jgi:hypothetical protein
MIIFSMKADICYLKFSQRIYQRKAQNDQKRDKYEYW